MSIDAEHLRDFVIDPVLRYVRLDSLSAIELLMGTAAQESHLGTYLRQIGSGPALGIFQMELATHNDIWDNYLKHKPDLMVGVQSFAGRREYSAPHPPPREMIWNLGYATLMCRVHYLRRPEPLPAPGDLMGQAHYWKEHYNTYKGKGKVSEYVRNYRRFVDG